MCIILLDKRTESDKCVDTKVLERCAEKHPDGLGLMYAADDKLVVWKSLTDFAGLVDRYKAARAEKRKVAIHFRRTTRGDTTEENLHPFTIQDDFAFMHNGTISALTALVEGKTAVEEFKGWSDTRVLNEELFRNWPEDFLKREAYGVVLDKLLWVDRMLFMDATGAHSIIGEHRQGAFWKEGVWYSNDLDKDYIQNGPRPTMSPAHALGKWTGNSGGAGTGSSYVNPGNVDYIFDFGLFGPEIMQKIPELRYVYQGVLEGLDMYAMVIENAKKQPMYIPWIFASDLPAAPPAVLTESTPRVEGDVYVLTRGGIDAVRKRLDLFCGKNSGLSRPHAVFADHFSRVVAVRPKKVKKGRVAAPVSALVWTAYRAGLQDGDFEGSVIVPYGSWDWFLKHYKTRAKDIKPSPEATKLARGEPLHLSNYKRATTPQPPSKTDSGVSGVNGVESTQGKRVWTQCQFCMSFNTMLTAAKEGFTVTCRACGMEDTVLHTANKKSSETQSTTTQQSEV